MLLLFTKSEVGNGVERSAKLGIPFSSHLQKELDDGINIIKS